MERQGAVSAIDKAVRAGHAAAARLATSPDSVIAAMSQPQTANEMLHAVAATLRSRGHRAECRSILRSGGSLFVGETHAAWVCDGKVRIVEAEVFDGHTHVVPPGCDTSTLAPGSRACTVDRIVGAIEKRIAARAQSKPVPVDASAIVRDPG